MGGSEEHCAGGAEVGISRDSPGTALRMGTALLTLLPSTSGTAASLPQEEDSPVRADLSEASQVSQRAFGGA